jgi:hypothetical protein
VLSLNGIPLVTAELKNPFTGQTWRDAVRQYKRDRDHTDRFIRDSLSRFPQPRRAACGAACVVIESGARFHPAAQLWPPLEYALQ